MLTFQEIIDNLNSYWKKKGCIQIQSYDLEMGAATFHPSTVLRVIDKEPWSAIFLQPCRRPSDGRYGENPNRLQHYYQLQVLIKPSPSDSQELYLESLRSINIDKNFNDIKLRGFLSPYVRSTVNANSFIQPIHSQNLKLNIFFLGLFFFRSNCACFFCFWDRVLPWKKKPRN